MQEICLYNALLGKLFAEAAKRVSGKCGVPLKSVHVIGSHGYVPDSILECFVDVVLHFSILPDYCTLCPWLSNQIRGIIIV